MPRAGRRLVFGLFVLFAAPLAAQPPATIAESSNYTRTSTHADVLTFCANLAKAAPNVVRVGELGVSGEKKVMPLLILADPPVSTPEEATKSGKLVVFAQGNIHAGEVDGKEALLMLAREIALAKERPLLKDIIFVVAPNVNPDGNDKMTNQNRKEQNGPPEVGTRANAAGLDLNRDFVKLETPEVRAMVRFYRQWNPAVVIDCHTTNGSHHRFLMTYDGPRHPAISENLISYVRDTLLPNVGKRLKTKTGFDSAPYGFMNREHTKWVSYEAQPRYGIQLVGLRGRIGLLSESYTYAPFKDRVTGSREFVRSILEFVAENKDAVRKVLDEATKPAERVALSHKLMPRDKPLTVLGFVENNGKPDMTQPKEYQVELVDRAEPTAFTPRPVGYLIPTPSPELLETMQRHGLDVLELREDIELACEALPVTGTQKAPRQYQGHNAMMLNVGAPKAISKRFPAGSLFIRTTQPLGRLAAMLLEPMSEDGLTTWNKFDAALKVGEDFPVYRLPKDAPLTAGPVRPLLEDRTIGKRIQVGHLLDGLALPNMNGNPVRGLQWLRDGEHFLQQKQLKYWKVHAATGKAEPFVDVPKLAKAIADALKIPAQRAEAIASGGGGGGGGRFQGGYTMNPQQTGFLFRERTDLCFAMFDGSKVLKLTTSPGNKELLSFSPNGEWVAFVQAQNLYAVDLATQKERKLTTDGGGKIFNGKADWVYWEEIFNRNAQPYWWSPDSTTIAFVRYDDTPVSPFPVTDHLPTLPRVENTPYPKAGHPNPLAKLGLVAAAGGPVRFVETPGYKPEETLLTRAFWQPDSKEILFFLTDRAQKWLDVMSATTFSEAPARKLFRETTKAWVNDPEAVHFLSDSRFLFYSERDGWKHLYLYGRDGNLIRRVSEGPWEVNNVQRVDEKNDRVYFTGTSGDSTGENLYRASINSQAPMEALTQVGQHRVQMSPTGAYFIDTASSHRQPTTVTLRRTDGQVERRLDTNPVYAIEEYKLGRFDPVHIPLKDGTVLEGTLLLPPDFDRNQKYPVWLMTYGGPHAPQVHDAWSFRTLDHVLSSLGIIVFHVDPRTASAKGAQSTWQGYKQMGVQEAKDIDSALDWLIANHPYVDAAHIGMSGGSYGGYLTCYCMTHSKKFAAGIATAPVTDWAYYDSIYTERYMDTPQNNKAGYEKSSVVRAAKDLHGRLLLVHGVMDDNVHVQNSVKLIEELQRAGKQFELMVYPLARHGVGAQYSRHYQRMTLDFMRRTMGK